MENSLFPNKHYISKDLRGSSSRRERENPLMHMIQSHSKTAYANVYMQALHTYALIHAHKLLFMQVIFLTVNE